MQRTGFFKFLNIFFIKNNIFDNRTEFLYLCPSQMNTKYKEIKILFYLNFVYSPVEVMTKTQGVDQQSIEFPDMRIVGSWSDVVS